MQRMCMYVGLWLSVQLRAHKPLWLQFARQHWPPHLASAMNKNIYLCVCFISQTLESTETAAFVVRVLVSVFTRVALN